MMLPGFTAEAGWTTKHRSVPRCRRRVLRAAERQHQPRQRYCHHVGQRLHQRLYRRAAHWRLVLVHADVVSSADSHD
jgi:hypothetical protein